MYIKTLLVSKISNDIIKSRILNDRAFDFNLTFLNFGTESAPVELSRPLKIVEVYLRIFCLFSASVPAVASKFAYKNESKTTMI